MTDEHAAVIYITLNLDNISSGSEKEEVTWIAKEHPLYQSQGQQAMDDVLDRWQKDKLKQMERNLLS